MKSGLFYDTLRTTYLFMVRWEIRRGFDLRPLRSLENIFIILSATIEIK